MYPQYRNDAPLIRSKQLREDEAVKRAKLKAEIEAEFGPPTPLKTNAQSWASKGAFTVRYG